MEVKNYFRLPINEQSHIAEARRHISALAQDLGLSEVEVGKVALLVTEMAGNLVKHTTHGGELLVSGLKQDGIPGVELISLDKGPGMANVAASMRDGYSTSGTPGTGLGAIQRTAEQFEIYSVESIGTALLARLWHSNGAAPAKQVGLETGAVCVAIDGETVSGDDWGAIHEPQRSVVMIADGLGHGPEAAAAAVAATRVLRTKAAYTPKQIIDEVHLALRGTRGAAVAVAEVNRDQQSVRYAGVGNIVGMVIDGDTVRRMVSMNGTAGHDNPHVQEFTYPWSPSSTLIMHSDGCHTRWTLDQYPGLLYRHPSLIASIIYRDFNRGRDDASVVVAHEVQ